MNDKNNRGDGNLLADLVIIALFVAAVVLVAYGLHQIFRPAMWIWLGAAAIYLAVGMSKTREK